MTKKPCAIIQCRYNSTRLPGKILKQLAYNYTCLDHIIDRLKLLNIPIIIATTDEVEDKEIVVHYINKYFNDNNVSLFQGSKLNIAKRLYEASEDYQYILRVTGDDLFLDIDVARKMLEVAMLHNQDYVSSSIIRGCDCDIIKRYALDRAMKNYKTDTIESLEFLFKNGKFEAYNFYVENQINFNINGFTVSMDTEEDWKLIKIVFNKLYPAKRFFGAIDIFSFLNVEPHLVAINKTPKVTVYTVFKDYPIDWLKAAIGSLQKQEYIDYEYILVDYGSKMIHTFVKDKLNSNEFRTFMTEDMTFIEAIKFAVKQSTGKYILRLDADDILKPNALSRMVETIEKTNASIVIPNHDRFVTGFTNLIIPLEEIAVLKEYNNYAGNIDNVMSCSLVEKKKYQYVQFIENQQFRDGTNILKAFKDYNFAIEYLPESLFYYRIHEKSLTNDKEKVIEADEKLMEELC